MGSFNEINPNMGDMVLGKSLMVLSPTRVFLPATNANNTIGMRLKNIVNQLKLGYDGEYMRLIICKQGDPMEYRYVQSQIPNSRMFCLLRFLIMMIEDKSHVMGAGFFDIWQKFSMSNQNAYRSQGYLSGAPPTLAN